jgi:hypothetical protein
MKRKFSAKRPHGVLMASAVALATIGTGTAATSVADARTTQITILSRSTAFGGYSFPGVGQYEVITGIASGEVDPSNPQNAVITDLQLAPRNAKGNV